MGVSTKGVVSSDINVLIKTLEKLNKKYNGDFVESNFKSKFDELKSQNTVNRFKSAYVHFTKGVTLTFLKLEVTDELKRDLPKSTRKLKTAREYIYISGQQSQNTVKVIMEILKAHPTNGFIVMNDSGSGTYVEVNSSGYKHSKKFHSLTKPERLLAYFYQDIIVDTKSLNLNFIKASDFINMDKHQFKKVYIEEIKKNYDGTTINDRYFGEIILIDKHDIIYIVDSMSNIMINRNFIKSIPHIERFVDSIPKQIKIDITDKQLTDVFPF